MNFEEKFCEIDMDNTDVDNNFYSSGTIKIKPSILFNIKTIITFILLILYLNSNLTVSFLKIFEKNILETLRYFYRS